MNSEFNLNKETVIKSFLYNNGNPGLMCHIGNRKFNLTLNLMDNDKYKGKYILKFWDEAEAINKQLIGVCKSRITKITVGIKPAIVCE